MSVMSDHRSYSPQARNHSLIFFPFRHKILLTKNRIKMLSAMCWLLAFSFCITIFFIPVYSGRTNDKFRCVFTNYVSQYLFEYAIAPFITFNMMLVSVFYMRMLYLLKRRNRNMANVTSSTGGAVMSSDAANNVTKLAVFIIGKPNMLIPCRLCRGVSWSFTDIGSLSELSNFNTSHQNLFNIIENARNKNN